ncbi:MAG TPA: SDR family oxidoreductase [Acidimicrobiia bacterium]|nr:SDR family oxidoreductase [Acidimicrobiia bacterium]
MTDKKVWLITGAGRGMGADIAKAALTAGHAVVATGRNTGTVTAALGQDDDLLAVKLDVTDPADAEAAVQAALRRFGRIDVLVNNAGIAPVPPSLREVTAELFDKTVAVNLKGPLRLTALAAEHMTEGGTVINISSTASLHAVPSTVVYAAAKAGLNALTKAAAAEYGPRGIRVNAIVCGTFHTDSFHHGKSLEVQEDLAANVGLRRIASADEIVGTALFLASEASAYLSGELVVLDGG